MSAMSDYLENEFVKHIFRTGSFSKPSTLYISLHTTATTDAGGGTEVSGNGYSRASVTVGDSNWDATSGTDGKTANTNTITFPAPSGGNWGTITHFAVWDASTSGNMLLHGALQASKTINDGDPAPKFNAGAFTTTIA